MPNRLASELSPYLLQHAHNPVDWYPWCPEVWERARREDKPIFLSVGYSACHWCHVMEHESFENGGIARLLNENFVAVKVDREERPELDQIYMEAVQMMTGHGGWPLSVFLTPELEPFYGGTYWPPRSRGGMPGFDQVLRAVSDAWRNRRQEAMQQAGQLAEALRDTRLDDDTHAPASPDRQLLRGAEAALARSFDPHFGGFGDSPKFPHPLDLRLLLRAWDRDEREPALSMVTTTLDKMAAGGIYDHLGGGFHRYSTDARWLVPHFEKMLYDNALLAVAYLEGYQATGRGDYARVVRETLDYVLRDMASPEGGFYSTEDADSEGHEGRFYLWTLDEIRSVLGGQRARSFAYVYDVSGPGNFEDRNILNRPKTLDQCAMILGLDAAELGNELAESRRALLAVRSRRVRPARDDKVLAGWNGLMIDALARAGAALGEPRYLEAASAAARFVLRELRGPEGRLLHVWRGGQSRHEALLDDHAALAGALVSLYEATFEEAWIDEAVRLADEILARFHDPREGGFFYASAGQPSLIARKKDMLDSSVPSGGGLATTALLRLAKLCGRNDYRSVAEASLAACMTLMERAPVGSGQMLLALDFHLGPAPEIVLLEAEDAAAASEVLATLHRVYQPNRVLAYRGPGSPPGPRSPHLAPLFEGKQPASPGPTLFRCEHFTCLAPVSGKADVLEALANPAGGR